MAESALPGYTLGKMLKPGSFGMVFEARRDSDGAVVAVKVISLSGSTEAEQTGITEEVKILQKLHHPNIVSFLASHFNHATKTLYIVTELCAGGDLQDYVSRLPGGRLPPADFARLVRPLLHALHHLHATNIMHRDIKVS